MNQAIINSIEYLIKISCDKINYDENCLKSEFINMLSYLSASDGFISDSESIFLNDYFKTNFSAASLCEYIELNNIYSSKFESTIPQGLIEFVLFDNNQFNQTGKLEISFSKTYCNIMQLVANEFLSSDGETSQNEVSDLSIYFSMLFKYREDNYIGPSDSVSAIDVNSIDDSIVSNNTVIDDLLKELNNLIGLDVVKNDVNSLIHLQEIKRIRKMRGLKEIPVSNHLVFYGNPGTGKTTVARLLAKIYYEMGILSKGHFVEVDRSGLVAGFVGRTAIKVQEVVKNSLGGILFIDEAYTLANNSDNDYGQEAIDTLLKAMEDNRDDFIVIVAGYTNEMAEFIDSNPGLRSRFNKYIYFEDYDLNELVQIFEVMCKNAGYKYMSDVISFVNDYFKKKLEQKSKNFANAREVRNFFELAIVNQANRLFYINNPTNEDLCTLKYEDVNKIQ